MNFLQNLCSCFSPAIRQSVIDYLSSTGLNRQVIQEQKCTQESQPGESIYAQAKAKSYYFMKLKQQDSQEHSKPSQKVSAEESHSEQMQPNFYHLFEGLKQLEAIDQVYKKKQLVLQSILSSKGLSQSYSKVYDSQDQLALKIYCKPQVYEGKRLNSYAFSFRISQTNLGIQDYLNLKYEGSSGNKNQILLKSRQVISLTEEKVQICHRNYNKALVISQHDFYTAQKCQKVGQGEEEAVFVTIFSIKSDRPKLQQCNRGWINLCGMKIYEQIKKHDLKGTSLAEEEERYLHFQGYINIQLDITVNANMLKQPIAKQIRSYIQKLVCQLTQSDAI